MSLFNSQKTRFPFNLNQSETSQHCDIYAVNSHSKRRKNIPVLIPTFFMRPRTPPSPITPSTSSLNDIRTDLLPIIPSDHEDDDDTEENEDTFLLSNGYKKTKKICDTLQGELYEAVQIFSRNTEPIPRRKVAIKKTMKSLHSQGIAKEDDMIYCVQEDIVKESKILHHLTVSNRCTADYIVQYIDFIESQNAYYLILEFIETNINLEQFTIEAHKYIKSGQLQSKQYNKIIKYIFWQIFTVIQWMHNDIHCAHLDLKLENIMLENADFVINKNGAVCINPNVQIKICDFGKAELFQYGNFKCSKPFDVEYLSPVLYADTVYDARSLDIWSLGIMLYHCCVGKPLFINHNENEYQLLKNNKLKSYLLKTKIISSKCCDLICNLLQINETHRFKIMDILKHECYKTYYQKYKKRILQKAKQQKLKLMEQKEILNNLPYYNPNNSKKFAIL